MHAQTDRLARNFGSRSRLNKVSESALHRKITDHYRSAIQSGELKPGDKLPAYRALVDKWQVSTSTVRTAMTALRSEGLVTGSAGGGTVVTDHTTTPLDWPQIKLTSLEMHERIESEYAPDLVLTMSGPGGFAAFLTMSYSTRLVPTLAAVTFPAREPAVRTEVLYQEASASQTWEVLSTDKWRVYLPGALAGYPKRTRVLLFDDRVLSGTTQRIAREHLESIGLEIRTAALVTSSENAGKVDYVGLIVDDRFRMPWGTDRGRT